MVLEKNSASQVRSAESVVERKDERMEVDVSNINQDLRPIGVNIEFIRWLLDTNDGTPLSSSPHSRHFVSHIMVTPTPCLTNLRYH